MGTYDATNGHLYGMVVRYDIESKLDKVKKNHSTPI